MIEYNDISETNIPTPSSGNTQGVNEAISISTGSEQIICRYNDVHDTLQYGIDYKQAVRGGAIYGNRIWNIEQFGIYFDTAARYIEDIEVYDNIIWNCDIGIVISREALRNTGAGAIPEIERRQTLKNIIIRNNLLFDMTKHGFLLQKHPQKDTPNGEITDVSLRYNTFFNCGRAQSWFGSIKLEPFEGVGWEGIITKLEIYGNVSVRDAVYGAEFFDNQLISSAPLSYLENLLNVDPGFVDRVSRPPNLALSGVPTGRTVGYTGRGRVEGGLSQDSYTGPSGQRR